jgi:AcrR family transcriptional regulator
MNRLATSKEDILAASRELIEENGWAAVSIRSVAAKCSVSAGTIYNYYESKAVRI